MNLDNVTVELRPRGPWEAADLGARMVHRDAATIYKAWFAITLPMLLMAVLAIVFTPYATLALLLYWWLEPVSDGPLLHILSRRLFGEQVSAADAVRATPALLRKSWIFLLTPYRFHFARSIATPVTQLEGLGGATRRARMNTLRQRIMNHGIGVTAAYQHLLLAIYFGVMLFVFLLIPTEYQDTVGALWLDTPWSEDSTSANLISLLLFYVAQTALHPWFVGSGFGLYINCRTQLEAWDIEVAFRRMALRRASAGAACLLLAVTATLTVLAPAAKAEDPAVDTGFPGYWSDEDVKPAVNSVFESDALNSKVKTEQWVRKDRHETVDEQEDSSPDLNRFFEILGVLGKLISRIFELGLWLVAAFLLYLLYLTRAYWLPYIRKNSSKRPSAQRVVLADGEIAEESLPADIPAEARRLWRNGSKRQALSLLFRGSVFFAVNQHGVKLPRSATEGACMQAVQQQTSPAYAGYFADIVTAWIWCAYGSQTPSDTAFESFCSGWQSQHEPAA